MVRTDQRIQVPDYEFLAGRKIIAQQVFDYAVHHLGMKDVPDQRHQQQQKREEGQNGVGGNGEGKGVHLGPEQIARGGAHQAFGWSRAKLDRAFLVGKLDGSDRRHWFLKYYQILTASRRGSQGQGPRCVALIGPWGHVRFQLVLSNFPLANRNLPAILFCSSPGPGWRVRSRVDVSVSAVRYRAFVFAAPRYFVAGNRPPECRGAVSVGAVSPARTATPARILTVPSRGCPVSDVLYPRANRQATEE